MGYEACQEIVAQGYGTIITAGGDGTLATAIDYISDVRCKLWGELEPIEGMPRIAVLPLGTGNAVACLVGPTCKQHLSAAAMTYDGGLYESSASSSSSSSSRAGAPAAVVKSVGVVAALAAFARACRSFVPQSLRYCLDWLKFLYSPFRYRRNKTARRAMEALIAAARLCSESSGRVRIRETTVPVIQIDDGGFCFLAGVGFDAVILNHYNKLRRWSKNTPLYRLFSSVVGYFVCTFTMTIPEYLRGMHRIRVRVSVPADSSSSTYYMDPRRCDACLKVAPKSSAVVLSAEEGEKSAPVLLYDGPASLVCLGTCPYYGAGMKLLPFARTVPGKMQLRIARITPREFLNAPFSSTYQIFAGTYRNTLGSIDLMGKEFTVEVSAEGSVDAANGSAFQQSGEAMGELTSFRASVAGNVRFVDFLGPPEPISRLDMR